jgi:hypothetical protein
MSAIQALLSLFAIEVALAADNRKRSCTSRRPTTRRRWLRSNTAFMGAASLEALFTFAISPDRYPPARSRKPDVSCEHAH